MVASVKYCGLTRPEDAAMAAALGASYLGVIFAGGPRHVSVARAAEVLGALSSPVRRVGVFATQDPGEVAAAASAVPLDVVQLHASPSAAAVAEVRRLVDPAVEVWAAVRVAGGDLPAGYGAVCAAADAIVVEALVPGQLGGTGVTADWPALARALGRAGRPRRLVLAGGLRPENVREALRLLSPEVVDVSSGVESAPGVKDRARMAAFAAAVGGHGGVHLSDFIPATQQTA